MVASLACTPNTRFPPYPPRPSRRTTRLDSREALYHLQRCRNFKHLRQIHAQILKNHLSHDHLLLTSIIRLSSLYQKIHYATLLFNQIQTPLTFTWNIMIRAHTINNSPREALLLYTLMIRNAVPPDKFTFPFVLKSCCNSLAVMGGKAVHAHVLKFGFAGDIFVQNNLLDMYLKFGDFYYARIVFDKMRVRNVVSWTTMVAGLVACGEVEAARGVFEVMPVRNVVSWTAMINGYARNGQPQEVFVLFQRMQRENVRPNEFTLVGLLMACTELGSVKLGGWIHEFAQKNGFQLGIFLGTALIDMYSKCGSIEDAIKVFNKMPERSLATWNTMITSLGVHGRGWEAVVLFGEMEKANVRPDIITFIGVLSACSNAHMVEEGYAFFVRMREHYGIKPTLEHYRCMAELLGNSNMLGGAYELVETMATKSDVDVWEELIRERGRCGTDKLGEVEHKHGGELDSSLRDYMPKHSAERQRQCFKWELG